MKRRAFPLGSAVCPAMPGWICVHIHASAAEFRTFVSLIDFGVVESRWLARVPFGETPEPRIFIRSSSLLRLARAWANRPFQFREAPIWQA